MKFLTKRNVNLFLILAGIIYCSLSLLKMNDIFCFSSGCSIYADYSLFGINFYWFGLISFVLLEIVYFTKNKYFIPLIVLFLFFDFFFLVYQSVVVPCSSCLVIAFLYFSLFIVNVNFRKNLKREIPVAIFSIFFIFNIGLVVKEQIDPWPIYGTNDAQTKLFFSTTCESCGKMLSKLLASDNIKSDVALYPITKDSVDYELTSVMECEINKDKDIKNVIKDCLNKNTNCNTEINFLESLMLKARLFKNKIHLLNLGKSSVPVLITDNYSVFDKDKEKKASLFGGEFNFEATSSCGDDKEQSSSCGF